MRTGILFGGANRGAKGELWHAGYTLSLGLHCDCMVMFTG